MTPFTDEHEMLRRTIRAFVEKEVVPQVAAWEEAGQIPRPFWRRLGELGLLGLEFPVEYGGGGGDFLSSVVLGEEMARCRSGGVAFSVLVHTDMSSPWLTRYGTEAQKRTVPAGHHPGRDRVRARHHRAGHGLRHGRRLHARGAARRSVSADRQQDLHHQRRLRRPLLRRGAHRGRLTGAASRRHLHVPGRARAGPASR